MVEGTVLGNVIAFFERLGVYDVILPFLLVFTIMFALLERTKVLGTEKLKDGETTKKSLNAMVAFVIAFLVVASSKIVEAITTVSSQIVILVALGIFLLMLVGAFYKEGEVGKEGLKENPWLRGFFIAIMVVGTIGIFLDALKTDDGDSWLDVSLDYLRDNWDSTTVASIFLMILVIAFIYFITKGKEDK